MQNGTTALENSSTVPQGVKHRFIESSSYTLRHLPMRNENILLHKNFYMNVHRCIILFIIAQNVNNPNVHFLMNE